MGMATAASDLDITVLLAGPPAPYRESLHYQDWPVELFVQTDQSLHHFFAAERKRGRPNTLRLIGAATVLVDNDGSGIRLHDWCARQLAAGPEALTDEKIRTARYGITDLLGDLTATDEPDERLMIASMLWHSTIELLLSGHRHWTGRGKWLHRELAAFDHETGTNYTQTLAESMRSVAAGSTEPMVAAVTHILDLFGGPLFDGFRLRGPDADSH
ncbi:hypothetical protein [Nocardia brasiliensis]|uniref:hypothetical protein n=1 Tax=Nocardia brasiliensis TaxID=37326 RepID=UPI003672B0A3